MLQLVDQHGQPVDQPRADVVFEPVLAGHFPAGVSDPLAHVKFPKIPRLSREMLITEKIDGTCGCVLITEQGDFLVGSKHRWIGYAKGFDNYGFAAWACAHKEDLIADLGVGRHFGEWWGNGIQRGYGCAPGERYFSLFNVLHWEKEFAKPERPGVGFKLCRLVPVLHRGPFSIIRQVEVVMNRLRILGSQARPGYMNPEGVVVCHVPSRYLFKKTFKNDEAGKERAEAEAAALATTK
jgi:hypothetical protein